jgi:hypothetical protein
LGKVMPMAFAFLATRSARSIVFGVDMSRSFLIAVTMLAALVAPAAGAEVPAQYRGLWCDGSKGYYRCREATSEGYLHIRRDRINLSEEGDCRITAVTPIAKGHRLRVYCPPDVLPDPPEHVNLRLDARGRLHLDSRRRPEKKAAPPSGRSRENTVC